MYLVHGTGPHVSEATFSLLTASRFVPFESSRIRYVVYTDQREAFRALEGVTVVDLEDGQIASWQDGTGYIHRCKSMAILDAFDRFGGRIVFVDSDTCFQRSPLRLFDRIGPGRSCLHLMENLLRLTDDADAGKIIRAIAEHSPHWDDGTSCAVDGDTPMWNSGVTGLDHSDLPVLRDALGLSDRLWRLSRANTCEQFSMGCAAARRTRISTASDVVFHYWPGFLKHPFRARLPGLLRDILALPRERWAEEAFRRRIRATPLQRLKQGSKLALRRLGRPTHGLLRSA